MNEEVIVVAKVGGAAGLGAAIALKFIPGNWWQRGICFVGSMGVGCLVGGAAVERFGLVPGSYTHMLAVAASAVFGLAIVNNGMQQIPEWMNAIRRRVIGS
ncbi:hypothetical protein [Cupriavidus pauculus]|uniref:hypothetical protein n=1 Tax=Cupriavidus pauculus TaxID=82633 RepID=UPI000781E8A1|nr:hypothetical protein [Cupriavidus pauculus]